MQSIVSLNDPRVAPYRNLRERTLRGENLFIAEAVLVVRRLIESDYQVESILATGEHAERFRTLVGDEVPIYVADRSLMAEIVGFPFHRGALAVGCRHQPPSIAAVMERLEEKSPWTLIVCPEATQAENLGMVFRTAAAFGVDAVVLGPGSCDPFCRRALRTSMGNVLRVPFVRSADLAADLRVIKERYGVRLAATVLGGGAELLPTVVWPERVGLMLGNEFAGLGDEWLDLCDHKITIPMAPGTDSLNLGVAAGVFVYERMRSLLAGRGWIQALDNDL
jgi:tRNA G18 (ribose-2'-O)-methylase SpoU